MINHQFILPLGLLILLCFRVKAQTAEENLHKDWANVKRYETANRRLTPATGIKNTRVIYMGDSITDLWIISDSAFFSSHDFIDRGISGQTTGQMLVRFREDVINLKPAAVIILAGINDIAENNGPSKLEDVMGNIVSMSELANINRIKVILCSVLPAYSFPWRPAINPVPKVKALNSMIKTYADSHHLQYLDYYSAMADTRGGLSEDLAKDGVHPTLKGYKLMEPLALKAIVSALK